jgi:hypothetical protein
MQVFWGLVLRWRVSRSFGEKLCLRFQLWVVQECLRYACCVGRIMSLLSEHSHIFRAAQRHVTAQCSPQVHTDLRSTIYCPTQHSAVHKSILICTVPSTGRHRILGYVSGSLQSVGYNEYYLHIRSLAGCCNLANLLKERSLQDFLHDVPEHHDALAYSSNTDTHQSPHGIRTYD